MPQGDNPTQSRKPECRKKPSGKPRRSQRETAMRYVTVKTSLPSVFTAPHILHIKYSPMPCIDEVAQDKERPTPREVHLDQGVDVEQVPQREHEGDPDRIGDTRSKPRRPQESCPQMSR